MEEQFQDGRNAFLQYGYQMKVFAEKSMEKYKIWRIKVLNDNLGVTRYTLGVTLSTYKYNTYALVLLETHLR